MHIEDRPLSEFELDCICEAQVRLRKDLVYMEVVNIVNTMKKELPNIFNEHTTNSCLDMHGFLEQYHLALYQQAFFDGEMFNIVKQEKLNKDK